MCSKRKDFRLPLPPIARLAQDENPNAPAVKRKNGRNRSAQSAISSSMLAALAEPDAARARHGSADRLVESRRKRIGTAVKWPFAEDHQAKVAVSVSEARGQSG
jgi:hypothetical protein